MNAIDQLATDVAACHGITPAATVAINGIISQITWAGNDPSRLAFVATNMQACGAELAAALVTAAAYVAP